MSFLPRTCANQIAAANALLRRLDKQREQVELVLADDRITDAYKSERVAEIATETRGLVESWHQDGVRQLDVHRRLARQHLDTVTAVDPSEVAAKAATLAPVIQSATTNPDGLVTSLRRNFEDRAARRLLEDTIAATLDALPEGHDRARLESQAQRARLELADRIPEEERGALDQLTQVDEFGGYVNQVTLIAANTADEMAAMDPNNQRARDHLRQSSPVAVATARHFAGQFEQAHSDAPAGV